MEWWHYEKNDEKQGPVTVDALKALLAAGTIKGDNLVWTKGMSDWQAAASVEGLAQTLGTSPPNADTLPVEVALAPARGEVSSTPGPFKGWQSELGDHDIYEVGASGPQRRPFLRFAARLLDIVFFFIFLCFILAVVAPQTLDDALFLPLVIMFVACFVEAALLSRYGTTPGKSLFNIRVLQKDGGKMSYGAALRRSFSVWLMGMAMGIQQLQLFTQVYACLKLENTGATPWDAGKPHIVVHRPLSLLRGFLGGLLFTVFFGLIVLNAIVEATMPGL